MIPILEGSLGAPLIYLFFSFVLFSIEAMCQRAYLCIWHPRLVSYLLSRTLQKINIIYLSAKDTLRKEEKKEKEEKKFMVS